MVVWPLTLKIDWSTWPFLKIDRRHDAYHHHRKPGSSAVAPAEGTGGETSPLLEKMIDMRKKYYRHDMGHFLNSTGDIGLFKIDMKICK